MKKNDSYQYSKERRTDSLLKKSRSKDPKKDSKKILLRSIVIICALLAVMTVLVFIISKSGNGDPDEQQNNRYHFDYANYDEDITQDRIYMGYDRSIYYTNPDGYMTVSVDRDNMEDVSEIYREPVIFIMDYIDAIIAGDAQKYNSFFDAEYYKNTNSSPKESFTPQKLYSIVITAVTYWYDDSGDSGTRYYNLGLDYMIKNNSGTLRNDMGSDAIRRIYLTIKENGSNLSIINESYFSKLQE